MILADSSVFHVQQKFVELVSGFIAAATIVKFFHTNLSSSRKNRGVIEVSHLRATARKLTLITLPGQERFLHGFVVNVGTQAGLRSRLTVTGSSCQLGTPPMDFQNQIPISDCFV